MNQKIGVNNMLEVQNLKYSYNNDYQALKGVSLKINEGDMVALLGKNGAGKSTLFLHLNGIYEPDEGKVFIDGEELKYDKKSLLKFRQKVGIVFQNPDDQIFAPTVEEDVAFGPLNLGLAMEEVQDRVEEALARVGMSGTEKIAPHHLSGGQKKRVAIAGILAMKPEIMVLDEPTAGLDPQGVENLVKLLKELNDEGITIVISTHEVDLVPDYANKVFVLVDGELIAEGTPKEIFAQPEVLERAHLKIPIVTDLFQQLETEGFDMENDYPLTVEEAKDKFLKLINKN
jgi:cobalt/nickel transport system ATP-binding protein